MSNTAKQAEPVHEPEDHDDDDFVAVPPGQSRLRFFFTLGLLIFVLLIFTVGPFFEQAVGGMFGGGGAQQVFFSWVHPDTNERVEYDDMKFRLAKRDLDLVANFGLFSAPSLREERGQLSDEDTAMFLVHERLAQDAGIYTGRQEVLDLLRQVFQSSEILAAQAQRYRRTPREIEGLVARVMAVDKYKGLILGAASMPDPNRVAEIWNEEEVEYQFEYVEVPVADFEAAALEAQPTDDELLEWYRAQPVFVQREYYTDDKFQAQVAWLPFEGEFDSAALMEAYPLPEEWDADAEARNYYNETVRLRFTETREVEQTEEETTDEGTEENTESEETESEETEPTTEQVTLTFEEVEEDCRREAPLRAALRAWLVDMRERSNTEGAELDFAAEAAKYGLQYESFAEPRTRDELAESEGWGGTFISATLAFSSPGAFLSNITVEEGGLVLAYLDEKVAGAEPPIADVRDDLVERWSKEQAGELALATLEGLHQGLAPEPEETEEESSDDAEATEESTGEESSEDNPEEAAEEAEAPAEEAETEDEEPAMQPYVIDGAVFRAAVEASGYEVVTRPFLGRGKTNDGSPDDATEGDRYITRTPGLFELEPGGLAVPGLNASSTHALMVRYVDKRPTPQEKMKPRDLVRLRQRVSAEAGTDFETRFMTADSQFVRDRYQLQMRIWETEDETTTP